MITRDEFLRSVEENIKGYEDKLNDIPKTASVLRNIVLSQIKAIHKLKADVLLGRDGTEQRTEEETKEAEEWLVQRIRSDWQ